jgi:hypothetical protein
MSVCADWESGQYVYVLIDMQDMYILQMLSVWISEFFTDIRVSSMMPSMRQYCSMSYGEALAVPVKAPEWTNISTWQYCSMSTGYEEDGG